MCSKDLKCGGIFNQHYCKFTAESASEINEIQSIPYLIKSWSYVSW